MVFCVFAEMKKKNCFFLGMEEQHSAILRNLCRICGMKIVLNSGDHSSKSVITSPLFNTVRAIDSIIRIKT